MTGTPRIGVVQQFDPRFPVPGGIDSVIEGILRYAPTGLDLVVIGADRSGDRSLPLGRAIAIERDGRTIRFLAVTRLGHKGRTGWIPETMRLALGLARFRRRVLAIVDQLQVHRSDLGAVTSILFRDVSRVQCIHGDSAKALRRRVRTYWRRLRRFHLALEAWSVRRAIHTFVFSRSGAVRLATVVPAVSYLPTWFDPSVVRTRRTTRVHGAARAVWVGRLEPEKDPLLALAALEAFVAAAPGREASIVGSGSLVGSLERTRTLPAVRLTGAMTRDEVAAALVEADVMLMTSWFEGSPVVIAEALAAGTPVVATRDSDPDGRIVDGRNGFSVPRRSVDDLAAQLERALALSRQECMASVEEYAAPLVVPRLFETVVGDPGPGRGSG